MLKRCKACDNEELVHHAKKKCSACGENHLVKVEFEVEDQVMQEPKGGDAECAVETPVPSPPYNSMLGDKYKPFIEWKEKYPDAYNVWHQARVEKYESKRSVK